MLYIQDRTGETVAIVSDYYNDMHKMYTQSGTGSYDFTVSRLDKGQEFIIEGNYVVMLDDEGKAHQFTIMKVTETETEKVVECEDASLQLLNKQRRAWIKPATAQPITYYANKALQGTGWEIGYNEVPNLNRTLEWTGSDSSLNRLFSIATQFDNAELDFHVELDRTRVIKRVVDVKKKLGSERDDIQLVYGDTVTGIQKTVSILNFRTALYGVGALVENTKENEPEKHYDFSAIEYDDGDFFSPKGDSMLYARKANERFNLGKEYIDEDYSFDTKDANELLKHTLTHLKEVSEPEINYEVELADFDGLHLTRGDTVRIIDHGYNPELLITARVIELDKSYTDPSQDKAIFGNFMSLVSGIDPMLLKIQQQLRQLPKARTPYPWVRYADDDKGTGMSALPAGKSYMATVWNYETAVPSDNPIDYAGKWVKVKGEDGSNGTPGEPGADGKTPYFHTAWADDISGTTGFTTSGGNGKAYIGTYSDFIKADSDDPSKYDWALFKGEDGQPGKDGTGIKTTVVRYQASSSGTAHPTGTWTSTVPAVTKGQYLWTRTDWTYTDGTAETGYTVSYNAKDGNNGSDGLAGKDGVGIKTTTITYQSGTSGTVQPTGTWVANPPSVTGGNYLWTRTVWSYTDGTSETGYSVAKAGEKGDKGDTGDRGLQGLQGPKGDQGIAGPKGIDGKTQYTHIAYANSADGVTDFTVSDSNRTYIGMYADFTSSDSTKPADYSWTLVKGANGANGTPGKAGVDGKTPYFHVAYADSADGKDGFYVGGGTNLYTDTQNFNDLASWYASKFWTKTTDTYKGLSVVQTTGSWNGLSQYIQVKKGDVLTYSVYAKYISGTGTSTIYWQIKGQTEGSYSAATANPVNNEVTITDTWQRVSGTTVATSDGYLRPRLERTTGNTNTLQIAGIKVEKGTTATPWSPAPSEAHPTYMGTYTDYTQADSLDPTAYSWTQVKGADGKDGEDGVAGKDGLGIKSTAIAYQLSVSGTTTPTGTWSTTVPALTKGQYLWTRTTLTYTDNSSEPVYSVSYVAKDGNNGSDGVAGKDGVGISSTLIEYVGAVSGTSEPTSGWSTTIPAVPAGQYLWTRTTWQYTDGTSEQGFTNALMGRTGAAGKDGVDGKDGEPGSKDVPVTTLSATQPATAKDGDIWWVLNSTDVATAMKVYTSGAWVDKKVDQAVLNIVTLNAVTINGSTINGSEFNISYTGVLTDGRQGSSQQTLDKNGYSQTSTFYEWDDSQIVTRSEISNYGGIVMGYTPQAKYNPSQPWANTLGSIYLDPINLYIGFTGADRSGIYNLSIQDAYQNSGSATYLNGWGSWNADYSLKVVRKGRMVTVWGYIKHNNSATITPFAQVPAWARPEQGILISAVTFNSKVGNPIASALVMNAETGRIGFNSGGQKGGYVCFSTTYVGGLI